MSTAAQSVKGTDKMTKNRNKDESRGTEWEKDLKQGVQGLQAFAFCVVNANDEHVKHRFKRKLRG